MAKRPLTASRSGSAARCQPWACAVTSGVGRSTERRRKARRTPRRGPPRRRVSVDGVGSESVRPAATRLRIAAATKSTAVAEPVSFPAARCALRSGTQVILRAFLPRVSLPPAAGDPAP
ncbi:hypothetical protein ZWY2020_049664 [Hordeum vulgare]|nr:hypothetical protein ZWY2020_049664 [Hordeum vulgare]